MKRVLVLGSSSFIGSHTVSSLLVEGYDVVGISRSPAYHNQNMSDFAFFRCNMNDDFDEVLRIIKRFKPCVVVNYVAQGMVAPSWEHPDDYFQTNTVSLVRLVKSLSQCDFLDKFIQMSTPEVYGSVQSGFKESKNYSPTTPYGASKAGFDMYLHMMNDHFSFPVVIARTANNYGPYQQLYRIIPKTMIKAKKGEKLPLEGGGESKRYFMYVSDLMNGVLRLIDNGKNGEIYHFSNLDYLSIRDLVAKICELVGYDFNDLVYIAPDRVGKDDEYAINCDKAKEELDWQPRIGIDEGLARTLTWIEDNWSTLKNESCEYKYRK